MAHTPQKPHEDPKAGYETTDAQPKTLVWSFISVAALMAAAIALMVVVENIYKANAPVNSNSMPKTTSFGPPPLPRLQINPPLELIQMRAIEDSVLASYGWVAKDSGIVRIPIQRAMALLLEQGVPVSADAAHRAHLGTVQSVPGANTGNESSVAK